jgi:gamma-glutamyltranspeptidase/glutathione hydrolase
MTPTFVLRKDGGLWFVVGSPGGPTIINTVLQIVSNVIDHGLNIRQATQAPRIHHQWLPDQVVREPVGLSRDTERALSRMGHTFAATPRYLGNAQAILIEEKTGVRLGASDPRGAGVVAGY